MAIVACTFVLVAGVATAQEEPTSEDLELPGTVLQAEQRDDGSTSAAPWVIGSAVAAVAFIGIGGTVVQRRSRAAKGSGGES
jgi:hypothetical protein